MGNPPNEFGAMPFCMAIIICIWLKSPDPEKLPLVVPFIVSPSAFS